MNNTRLHPHTRALRATARTALLIPFLVSLASAQASGEADEVFELNPFQVEAASANEYRPETSNTGTIIAIRRDQIPFQTSVVTDALIDDLRIDNPADIVDMIAGVSQDRNPFIAEGGTSRQISYRVRGFESEPLYNGFQTGPRIFGADNVSRVEVSKGPNAVLYGQAPAGGIINVVPKPAVFESHGSATLGVGSNSYERFLFDTGGAIEGDKAGRMAFRVGGGYLGFERDQPFFDSQTTSLNAATAWRINEKVSLDVQAEYLELNLVPSRTEAFVTTGSGPARVVDPYNRLRNLRDFSYSGPYNKLQRDVLLSTAYLNIRLTENLHLRAGGFYSTQDIDSHEFVGAFGLGTSETATSLYAYRTGDYETVAYKLDLLHEAEIAGLNVRSLVGYEDHAEDNYFDEIRTPSTFAVTVPFSRNTIASDWPEPPALSAYTTLRTDQLDELDWSNLRFTQFISTGDERGTLMWGVAYGEGDVAVTDFRTNPDTVSTADGSDTTYTVGGTYEIFQGEKDATLNSVGIFANYSTSFEIQSGNQQDPSAFQGFTSLDALKAFVAGVTPNAMEPQTGSGYEVGLRFVLNEGKLGLTVAWFDQSRENIARNFFVRESNVAGNTSETVLATYQLAGGEESSKGVELSVYWEAFENFVLTAEAMLSDGEVVANTEAPEEVGFGLVRAPEDTVSLWARYSVPVGDSSPLAGFTFGAGLTYNTPTRIRPEINDRYRISDYYTNVRALVGYAFSTGNYTHQLNLNVDNLLDDEWTNEANFLSDPRTYKFTYSVSF